MQIMGIVDSVTRFLATLTDTFARADSASSLGNAASGVPWTATTGTWGITGTNKAYSTTAASSYPMAVIDTGTLAATVKETPPGTSGQSGHGVSFWVTNTNDWWGAFAEKTSYTAAPYNCPSGGSLAGTNCAVTNSYGASGGPGTSCGCNSGTMFGCQCWYYSAGYGWINIGSPWANVYYSPYNAPYNCPSGGSLSGATCYFYSSYAATASTWYKHDIKLIKRAGGALSTVSTTTVANTTNTSSYLAYIQAATTANAVAVTSALSETPNTVVTANAAAGTPVPAVKHGILAAPGTLNSLTEIETFVYTAPS